MSSNKFEMDYEVYDSVVSVLEACKSSIHLDELDTEGKMNLVGYLSLLVSYQKFVQTLSETWGILDADIKRLKEIKANYMALDNDQAGKY